MMKITMVNYEYLKDKIGKVVLEKLSVMYLLNIHQMLSAEWTFTI